MTMSRIVESGKMRSRAVIQSYADVRDVHGGIQAPSWSNDGYWWCSITPVSGEEYLEARKMDALVTHKAKGRYSSFLTTRKRLSWDSRFFYVVATMSDADERYSEVLLREDTA
jgi:SPP1 family predicted phage head-tail adaptor